VVVFSYSVQKHPLPWSLPPESNTVKISAGRSTYRTWKMFGLGCWSLLSL